MRPGVAVLRCVSDDTCTHETENSSSSERVVDERAPNYSAGRFLSQCSEVCRCDRMSSSAQAPVDYGPSGPYMCEPPAEDCSQPKPVFIEPQPQMWVQPAAPMEMVPIMPLPESVGPRPGAMMGPMFGAPGSAGGVPPGMVPPPAEAGSPRPLENIAPGGAISPQFGLPAAPEAVPALAQSDLRAGDERSNYAWEQIADVVSDYFTIAREQQVRRSGEAWSEGRIETAYQGGASWLEPFRKDSVGAFNRWESTFQTIRRRAVVRVMPDANGLPGGSDRGEGTRRLAASGAGDRRAWRRFRTISRCRRHGRAT